MKRLVLGSFLLALLLHAGVAAAAPAPGDIDRSFGQGGYVSGDTFAGYGSTSVAGGPRGDLFVLVPDATGCDQQLRCTVQLRIAHFFRNGSRDAAFDSASFAAISQTAYDRGAIVVGVDGKPVIAAVNGERVLVERFGSDGDPDPSFGTGGVPSALLALPRPRGTPPVVAVGEDGRVLLAYEADESLKIPGPAAQPAGEGRLVLARFFSDGSLDRSFGENGVLLLGSDVTRPAGIAFRSGGGFDVGLSRCCRGEGGADLQAGVDRLQVDGTMDRSLKGTGQLLLSRPTATYLSAIAAGPGGKVYLLAEEESRGSVLVRLTPIGAPDPAFGKGGEVQLGREVGVAGGVRQIVADSSGRILGVAGAGAGVFAFRLLKSGRPDRTFAAGRAFEVPALGVNLESSGLVLQPRDRPVVVIESGTGGSKGFSLARLNGGTSKVRCLGKRATIVGTNAAEKIVGTRDDDVIAAMGGTDRVQGRGGDDRICGGKGRDRLFGGAGRDRSRQ